MKLPSTLIRQRMACELMRQHYEPGNQARNLKQVWRCYAHPQMGIGYRTFLRLVHEQKLRMTGKVLA